MRKNCFHELYLDVALQIKHDRRSIHGSWDLHCHDFYECFLVTGGNGLQLFPDGQAPLLQDHLTFVRPEHAHGFRADPHTGFLSFFNIVLRFDLVENFRHRHPKAFPPAVWNPAEVRPVEIELAPGQCHEFRRMLDSLIFSNRSAIDVDWFLSSLSRMLQPLELDLGTAALPVWLREGLYAFREPETLRGGVKELVKRCRCSPEHLAREMKRHLGKRPVQWINDQKIRYATLLLQTTDLSVTEVALEVGVNNLSHFHALFKQHQGVTPLQYRVNHHSPGT